MMKITYDQTVDAFYIKLTENCISRSEEVEDNIIVDFDENNKIVGIEVLYFVAKHRQDFFPVFKQVEQSVWGFESLATG